MGYVLQFGEIAHEEYIIIILKIWKHVNPGMLYFFFFFFSELFHAIRRSKYDAHVLSSLSVVQRQSQANFKLMVIV